LAEVDEERLRAVLESLLFASGEPVSLARLAAVLDPVPKEAIRKALADLKDGFHRDGRGVMLDEVAGGYQLRTPREHALYVRRLLAARPPRLSRPMMETLAIVAYRQPITRPEIEQLRGVDSGAVLETLTERRLVRIAGRKEAPGRPLMYATTSEFLQTFGLKDLDSLPDLSELREVEQQIEAAEQERLGESSEQGGPEQLELVASAPSEEAAPAPSEGEPQNPPESIDPVTAHPPERVDSDSEVAAVDAPESAQAQPAESIEPLEQAIVAEEIAAEEAPEPQPKRSGEDEGSS
jgi:segregation and condensation protein B